MPCSRGAGGGQVAGTQTGGGADQRPGAWQVSIAAPASLDPGWHSTWRLAPTLQSQPRATDLRGGHWPGGAGPSCSGPVH